jgi:16S rRNA G966 N2-methylase RsmD
MDVMTISPEEYRNHEGYMGAGSEQKHKINEMLAPTMEGKKVLDAFAGIGLGTRTFAEHAEQVTAIELDEENFKVLEEETAEHDNIKLYEGNNIDWMQKFASWGMTNHFDVIDLDPFQSYHKQLPHALKLLNSDGGLLLLTTGEAFGAFRERFKAHSERGKLYNLTEDELENRWYSDINSNYWKFPYEVVWERFTEPMLEEYFGSDFELLHYYVYPRLSRFVVRVGSYDIPTEVTDKFNPTREHSDEDQLPKHIGHHQGYTQTSTGLSEFM